MLIINVSSICIQLKWYQNIQIPRKDKNEKLDDLMTSCVNGIPQGVGCHFSPSGSNLCQIPKISNKSLITMFILILVHEVGPPNHKQMHLSSFLFRTL